MKNNNKEWKLFFLQMQRQRWRREHSLYISICACKIDSEWNRAWPNVPTLAVRTGTHHTPRECNDELNHKYNWKTVYVLLHLMLSLSLSTEYTQCDDVIDVYGKTVRCVNGIVEWINFFSFQFYFVSLIICLEGSERGKTAQRIRYS